MCKSLVQIIKFNFILGTIATMLGGVLTIATMGTIIGMEMNEATSTTVIPIQISTTAPPITCMFYCFLYYNSVLHFDFNIF